jgi:hypothetical protein
VYIAHAAVEAEINGDFYAADKALQLAAAVRPSLSHNPEYVLSYACVLRRLGDVGPIRRLFRNALGDDVCEGQAANPLSGTREKVVSNKQARLQLWEEFLKIELSMGLSATSRFAQLRAAVVAARASAYPQGGGGQPKAGSGVGGEDNVFFDYTAELFERHATAGVSLPLADAGVKDRCRGAAYIDELVRSAELEVKASEAGRKGRAGGKHAPVAASALDADSSIVAGLPAFFRELLSKLPVFAGPAPDVDAFVDSLRRTVLPPRPAEDASSGDTRPGPGPGEDQEPAPGAPAPLLGKRSRAADEGACKGGTDGAEGTAAGRLGGDSESGGSKKRHRQKREK